VDITQDLLIGARRSVLDDPSLISHCRDGLNKAHHDISLSLLDIQQWAQWKHALMQRSFVAKLSSFTSSSSAHSGDRRSSGGRQEHVERANSAVGGTDVTCYGCGERGHYKKDCTVPNIATRECRNCGSVGHIAKACKKPSNDKPSGAGAGASSSSKHSSSKKGGSSGKKSEPPSKAVQALRLLEVAKKERDKIQARADKRASEYAAAARVVADLNENNDGGRTSGSSGSRRSARFVNNDEDEDEGVEQYEAPARGSNAPRKGSGKAAVAGGFHRALLFLSLCMACTIPIQASVSPISFDSQFIASHSVDLVYYDPSFDLAPPVSLSFSSGSLDYSLRDHARDIHPRSDLAVPVYPCVSCNVMFCP
jgi:hypothetical protein